MSTEQNEAESLRVRVAELETAPLIEQAGADPRLLAPLVREYARENPGCSPEEIVAALRTEPDTATHFGPKSPTAPAERDLAQMSDREKTEYISQHGLEAFAKLVDKASKQRAAEMQRKYRGF